MMTEEERRRLFAEQCRYLMAATRRLGYTLARCQGVLPQDGALSAVPEDLLERLDALAVRFARCQELTGTLLRSEAILLGIQFDDYPKLLDTLRKHGLHLSIGEWQVLRELRNDVGHIYLGTDHAGSTTTP